MKPIYMDHHATTPLDPRVLDAMMPYLRDEFGNPSSITHIYGREARKAVDRAREQVASLINAASPNEIVFTGGATESDNLALKGVAMAQSKPSGTLVTLETEHKAILDTARALERQGFKTVFAPIDTYGRVDLDRFKKTLDKSVFLVSIQAGNSEIGTVQDLNTIGAILKEMDNVIFHTDAVQALGKLDVDVQKDAIDLLSISGHKMYGPKGVGALYVRKGIRVKSLIDGGGHEGGVRSGTLNVPGIVGLGKAAELAKQEQAQESQRLLALREKLINGIQNRIDHVQLNGHPTFRLPNNVNFSFAFVEGESLLLSCRDVALSSGSACTSSSLKSSYVLKAIDVPDSLAHCSIRFGLGKSNTEEHIDLVLNLLETHVQRLRDMSPLYEMAQQGIDIDSFDWGKHSHD